VTTQLDRATARTAKRANRTTKRADRNRRPLFRFVPLVLLVVYLGIVAVLTLGPGDTSGTGAQDNLRPFATINRALDRGTFLALFQVVGNGLLFVPFGFLAPLAFPRLRVLTAVFVAAAASAALEIVQLTHIAGRIFDVDDVILNVAGACLGGLIAGIWRLIAAIARALRLRSATRPARASASPRKA
jgi:glycopeptide antibiotics resistance protein